MLRTSFVAAVTVLAGITAATIGHAEDSQQTKQPSEKFGRVLFETSCTPEAHKEFERALSMQHSFFFPETIKAFTKVAEIDPSCAIAYWGIAIGQTPNPIAGPWDAGMLKRGLEAVERGKAVGAKTERERDWIAAIGEFYKDHDKVDHDTRMKNYEKAMEALTLKYPDDVEAKIFYALALNQSVDYTDRTYSNQLKAAKILEPIAARYPDHPGVTHYLIHSYDFVPIAKRGVAAANKYDKIAPSAPHALHMPSHIYSMVGMWEASIESNLRSAAVMKDYAAKNHPDAAFTALTHDFDFMQVAYLQLGQDGKAQALMQETGKIQKINGPPRLSSYNGLTAVPARYYLERQDWRGAAQLQPRGTPFPYADAITYFARAMGAARLGEFAAAQADIDKLKELRATLERAKDSYWAEQIEIQILAAQGWVAQGQGRGQEALKFMRAAADVEDASEKTVSMENRLYPMRELLGDMLREQGAGAAALKEYEASMLATPNRLRGYYGAAKAAEMIGDTNKAMDYFRSLVQLARNGDGDRAEIREAKQALAKK